MALKATEDAGSAGGLRDRKKSATRQSLREAALRLFDEKGFSETSVDEIADRADVSRSTFFRYFGSKEAVLFAPGDEILETLTAALLARPAEEPPIVAYEEALIESLSARRDVTNREFSRIAEKLTLEEPALRTRRYRLLEESTETLARAFAQRSGRSVAGVDDYLAAAVCVAAGMQVGREFRVMEGAEVVDSIRDVFARLRKLLDASL